MILYHGSNCDSMAGNALRREGCGCRTINVYEFDEATARNAGLSIRSFSEMNLEWMTFVIANRVFDRSAADHNLDNLYDVVSGYIADDRIQALMRAYCAGMTTSDQILKAMSVVYGSNLQRKLEDPETGLYREGPVYLYDMLCEERGIKSRV